MARCTLLLLASFISFLFPVNFASAEEIPLETCDRLPVIEVKVSGARYRFLVDTAATSVLNLNSFSHGESRTVIIRSWNGTIEARGQEVMLADLSVGQHHFKNLKLRAVDLSAIGQACGKLISGILGIDLLRALNATLDLNDSQPRLLVALDSQESRAAELDAQLMACEQAFNHGEQNAFAECLDPQIVFFTVTGDYYGRPAVMQFLSNRYFQQHPPAQLSLAPRAHHAFGEGIWIEYDMQITSGAQILVVRGTALCQKENGRWRIVHMNHSRAAQASEQFLPADAAPAP
jgi:ketosteroid isomerase-like protein